MATDSPRHNASEIKKASSAAVKRGEPSPNFSLNCICPFILDVRNVISEEVTQYPCGIFRCNLVCSDGYVFLFPLMRNSAISRALSEAKVFFYIFKCIGKQDSIVIGNHTNVGRGRGSGYVAADTEPAGVGNNDKKCRRGREIAVFGQCVSCQASARL